MATSTDLHAAIEEIRGQFPLEGAADIPEQEKRWATRLEQRLGAMPWWTISAVVHAVLFLLISLVAVAVPSGEQDEITIFRAALAPEPLREYKVQTRRDIFTQPVEVEAKTEVEQLVLAHEPVEVSERFETANDMNDNVSRGREDAISDIPSGEAGIFASIGVGDGGMAGCHGYRGRGGRRTTASERGGSPLTESAVEAALRWLARHQEPDGHWDCAKYEGTAKGTMPDTAVTGLALLAFLGAGYTEKSGQFADNVKRAEEWLLQQQQPNGCCVKTHGSNNVGYGHAIAGLALAEAYGMGQDPKIREAAQKALDYSINEHQCPYSGWRYNAKQPADLSVSGWFVMQLKSAKIAGLTVDGAGFQGAQNFLDKVSDGKGGAGYQGPQMKVSTTSIGMVCREFMGAAPTEPMIIGAGDILADPKNLPKWGAGNRLDFYYLYYGTLGMFQLGGERWKKWNEAMKPLLVDNQCKGPEPLSSELTDKDGSWDPYGANGNRGGRVFQTAIGALSLEVYYRYLPMYTK